MSDYIYHNKEWLQQKYWGEYLSIGQMAVESGHSVATIHYWMIRHRIPRRSKNYKAPPVRRLHDWDFAFFQSWSPAMAYVLGFSFADGCITKDSETLELTQKNPDILLRIVKAMGGPPEMIRATLVRGRVYYRVSFTRLGLRATLARYGLEPAKSLTMTWPSPPKEFLGPFIRGYFDGDGFACIWMKATSNRQYCSAGFTSGSNRFLQGLQAALCSHGLSKRRVNRGTHCYQLIYSRYADIVALYRLMYAGTDVLYMHHKKARFDQWLSFQVGYMTREEEIT